MNLPFLLKKENEYMCCFTMECYYWGKLEQICYTYLPLVYTMKKCLKILVLELKMSNVILDVSKVVD